MHFFIGRKTGEAVFVHPLQPVPKTAILVGGFAETRLIRVFPEGWGADVARFSPGAIAGPLSVLRGLPKEQVELSHAVIVLNRGFDCLLTDRGRDWLWRAFGVPVFEQVLGERNELLAYECGAHEGLHVLGEGRGLELERAMCGCGSAAPRLREREPALRMAAIA